MTRPPRSLLISGEACSPRTLVHTLVPNSDANHKSLLRFPWPLKASRADAGDQSAPGDQANTLLRVRNACRHRAEAASIRAHDPPHSAAIIQVDGRRQKGVLGEHMGPFALRPVRWERLPPTPRTGNPHRLPPTKRRT
jgi:hypothetical protein